VFRHTSPFVKALEPVQSADWAELNRPRISAALEVLDAQLQHQPFVAGANFTVADITAVLAFQILDRSQFVLPERFAGAARWRAEVFRRPSVVVVIGLPKD
jgi:glutathione S-transferase